MVKNVQIHSNLMKPKMNYDAFWCSGWMINMVLFPHVVLLVCLHYTQGGCSSQRKVSTRLRRFMVGDWFSFQEESSRAFQIPHCHRFLDDSSTTRLH